MTKTKKWNLELFYIYSSIFIGIWGPVLHILQFKKHFSFSSFLSSSLWWWGTENIVQLIIPLRMHCILPVEWHFSYWEFWKSLFIVLEQYTSTVSENCSTYPATSWKLLASSHGWLFWQYRDTFCFVRNFSKETTSYGLSVFISLYRLVLPFFSTISTRSFLCQLTAFFSWSIQSRLVSTFFIQLFWFFHFGGHLMKLYVDKYWHCIVSFFQFFSIVSIIIILGSFFIFLPLIQVWLSSLG